MDEQDFEKRIEQRWRHRGRGAERGRIWVGLFLLVIGGLFLARESGVYFPAWFFSWPVFLIGVGIFMGVKHGFRGIGWLFPIVIGSIFLFDRLSPSINLRPYLWPMILIAAGLFILIRPKSRRRCYRNDPDDNASQQEAITTTDEASSQRQQAVSDRNDVIDVTAVFGGVKKNMLSKNFKGGDIVAIMGGSEINLSQADFKGKVMIDCFNMFGGTKLIIPLDWEVQSDIVAIFGGVDDKRPPVSNPAPDKILYLDGTCLFGGLEIKSY